MATRHALSSDGRSPARRPELAVGYPRSRTDGEKYTFRIRTRRRVQQRADADRARLRPRDRTGASSGHEPPGHEHGLRRIRRSRRRRTRVLRAAGGHGSRHPGERQRTLDPAHEARSRTFARTLPEGRSAPCPPGYRSTRKARPAPPRAPAPTTCRRFLPGREASSPGTRFIAADGRQLSPATSSTSREHAGDGGRPGQAAGRRLDRHRGPVLAALRRSSPVSATESTRVALLHRPTEPSCRGSY